MKKLIKLGFFAGAMLLSGSVFAKDVDFSLSFENVENKKVEFKLTNAQNVAIYLYNEAQSEIYSEKILNENNVVKSYDLADMPDGNYFLVAESSDKLERYKITVNNKQLFVDETPVSAIAKPQFNIEGNRVKMYIPNINGAVNISVYDLQDNDYYENKKEAQGDLSMVFDLNPDASKNYVINVEMEGNSFNKIISLK